MSHERRHIINTSANSRAERALQACHLIASHSRKRRLSSIEVKSLLKVHFKAQYLPFKTQVEAHVPPGIQICSECSSSRQLEGTFIPTLFGPDCQTFLFSDHDSN